MSHAAFRVHVVDLRKRVGERRDISRSYETPELRVGESVVVAGTAIEAKLEVESVHGGGIVASGRLRASWTGVCRRCLDVVADDLHVEVREVFEPEPTEGETYPLDGDDIDVAPLIQEAMSLALPLSPLCRDDCAGPDPDRFPASVVTDPDPDEEPPVDPRWAALSELTFDE